MIEYTSTVTGRAAKVVTCEECDHRYVYHVERTGTGTADGYLLFSDPEGMGEAESEKRAHADALRQLARAVEIVPCPRCGRVQTEMVAEARSRYLRWLTVLALVVFTVGFLAGAAAFVSVMASAVDHSGKRADTAGWYARAFAAAAAGLIAVSIGLGVLKLRLNRRIDPNAEDQVVRIKMGKQLALPQ